jgi:hypothetical protein
MISLQAISLLYKLYRKTDTQAVDSEGDPLLLLSFTALCIRFDSIQQIGFTSIGITYTTELLFENNFISLLRH